MGDESTKSVEVVDVYIAYVLLDDVSEIVVGEKFRTSWWRHRSEGQDPDADVALVQDVD